jgi:hypothetical protein
MSFHASQTFVFGEQPSASKWQYLWDNDYALADGTGISNGAIITRHFGAGAVDSAALNASIGLMPQIGIGTLAVAGDTLTVSSLPSCKYLRVLVYVYQAGAVSPRIQFNGDAATNYSYRSNANNGTSDNGTTQGSIAIGVGNITEDSIAELIITNVSNHEKLVNGRAHGYGGTGSASLPSYYQVGGKWVNTSTVISSITLTNASAGDFGIGTQMIVQGRN